jgi:hypothetical protein
MTKNSLKPKAAESKREEHRPSLTRADELLAESNVIARHAEVTGFRSLRALAELRALDALDQLEIDAYAPAPQPARGDLVALALTLDALAVLRLGRRGDG